MKPTRSTESVNRSTESLPRYTQPIKPSEVVAAKKETMPPQVIQAFNEMIAKHWSGHESAFRQDEVVALICKLSYDSEITSSEIYDNKWLDVEDIYRKEGWIVEYQSEGTAKRDDEPKANHDKPGWNENYAATFSFRKPK